MREFVYIYKTGELYTIVESCDESFFTITDTFMMKEFLKNPNRFFLNDSECLGEL